MKKIILGMVLLLILSGCAREHSMPTRVLELGHSNSAISKQVNKFQKNNISQIIWEALKNSHKSIGEDDYDVIYKVARDFDQDGQEEYIFALGDQSEDTFDSIYYIYLVENTLDGYDIASEIQSGGYEIYEASLIKLNGREDEVLLCNNTNTVSLVGIEIYEVVDNEFHQILYSASPSGSGSDYVFDSDNDGDIDGYSQYRSGYDVLYLPIEKTYIYSDGNFELSDLDVELDDYPKEPERVVSDYLTLKLFENIEEIEIESVQKRIEEMTSHDIEATMNYKYGLMMQTRLVIEPLLYFYADTNGDHAEVNVSYETDDAKTSIEKYYLERIDDQWVIIGNEVMMKWNELITTLLEKRQIDFISDISLQSEWYESWVTGNDISIESLYPESYRSIYSLDIDQDGAEELLVHRVEGSVREQTTDVYHLNDGVYKRISYKAGNIIPVNYNGENHYIDVVYDFNTKLLDEIIEYAYRDDKFVEVRTFDLDYRYDVSELSEYLEDGYLESLDQYELSENVNKLVEAESNGYKWIHIDDKDLDEPIELEINLFYTSVGYAPTQWYIEAGNDYTANVDGIDELLNIRNQGTNNNVLYGFDVLTSADNEAQVITVSYSFFDNDLRNNDELNVRVFDLKDNKLEEIEDITIKPRIDVTVSEIDE